MGVWRQRAGELVLRLRPEERIAAVYALAVAALLVGHGMPVTVVPILVEYLRFVGAIAMLAVPVWIGAQLVAVRRRRFQWARFTSDLYQLGRAMPPLLVVLVGYTNLKSRLFQLHAVSFDSTLARLDALVHFGGGDFVGWLLTFHVDRRTLALLGAVYFYAWLGIAAPFAAAFARGGGTAARRILFALGLVYVAGGFLYLAAPALGPAFFDRARFAPLAWGVPFQIQESMLQALRAVARDPTSPAVPFFGIAAMPSLHLATTALGLFAAWRWARWLLVVLVPLNVAVAWSAIVWGWHYAIDFYPGLLLAWGGWWAAGELLQERPTGEAPTADDDFRDEHGSALGSGL